MRRALVGLCALWLVACTSSASPPDAATPEASSPAAATPEASSPADLEAYMAGFDVVGPSPDVLTIYPPGHEQCKTLELSTACYQIVQPNKPGDLGSQGSAAMEDGLLALTITLCAFCDENEVGSTVLLEPQDGGAILVELRCEPEGAPCPDRGTSFERQD